VRLADEIGDFGGLVGLLLALATLLTANRASALDGLKKAPRFDSSDKWREALLDAALAIITALVFLRFARRETCIRSLTEDPCEASSCSHGHC
jgi:hypothetical protein